MALSDEFIDAIRDRERDQTKTFTMGGTSYACNASEIKEEADLEHGGWEKILRVTITVRQSLFTSPVPTRGYTITYEGKEFSIDSVKEIAATAAYRLECVKRGKASKGQ